MKKNTKIRGGHRNCGRSSSGGRHILQSREAHPTGQRSTHRTQVRWTHGQSLHRNPAGVRQWPDQELHGRRLQHHRPERRRPRKVVVTVRPQPSDTIDMEKIKEDNGALSTVKNGPRRWTVDNIGVKAGKVRDFQGLKAHWVMWFPIPA